MSTTTPWGEGGAGKAPLVAAAAAAATAIVGIVGVVVRPDPLHAVVASLAVLASAAVAVGLVQVQRHRGALEERARELEGLYTAGLDVAAELSLDAVLERVVELARGVVGARYAAMSVIDEDERVETFVVSGVDGEQRRRIGDLPRGRGLLGVPLHQGQRLRLADMTKDPRRAGFPPHHPTMRSLLAVPVSCRAPYRGNLYCGDPRVDAFDARDEDVLARFAAQAAIAIDNAHLHQQVRHLAVVEERTRISREMHDGLAQVLAYVNAKTQAVREFVVADRREEAVRQLDQLAGAAREVYADVREAILGLRTELGPGRSISDAVREYVDFWRQHSEADVEIDVEEALELEPKVEVQLLRIVQEALANVRKHASASRVRIELCRRDGSVHATIVDDGVGFDQRRPDDGPPTHFGLVTMRERAEGIGGDVEVEATPGAGVVVRARVPAPPQRVTEPRQGSA